MPKQKINLQKIIDNNSLSSNTVYCIFNEVIAEVTNVEYAQNLQQMFSFALDNDNSLFPTSSVEQELVPMEQVREYLANWCRKYIVEKEKPEILSPLKSYGQRDTALINRVSATTDSDDETETYLRGHFIFMNAENENGIILEKYLAKVLEPYGWIWCAGATFKAIDFCLLGDETILLQVKNKYNTENSSSAAIRSGTIIKKWNRLNKPRVRDGNKPRPNWKELWNIVHADENLMEELSEKEYLNFISNVSSPNIDQL